MKVDDIILEETLKVLEEEMFYSPTLKKWVDSEERLTPDYGGGRQRPISGLERKVMDQRAERHPIVQGFLDMDIGGGGGQQDLSWPGQKWLMRKMEPETFGGHYPDEPGFYDRDPLDPVRMKRASEDQRRGKIAKDWESFEKARADFDERYPKHSTKREEYLHGPAWYRDRGAERYGGVLSRDRREAHPGWAYSEEGRSVLEHPEVAGWRSTHDRFRSRGETRRRAYEKAKEAGWPHDETVEMPEWAQYDPSRSYTVHSRDPGDPGWGGEKKEWEESLIGGKGRPGSTPYEEWGRAGAPGGGDEGKFKYYGSMPGGPMATIPAPLSAVYAREAGLNRMYKEGCEENPNAPWCGYREPSVGRFAPHVQKAREEGVRAGMTSKARQADFERLHKKGQPSRFMFGTNLLGIHGGDWEVDESGIPKKMADFREYWAEPKYWDVMSDEERAAYQDPKFKGGYEFSEYMPAFLEKYSEAHPYINPERAEQAMKTAQGQAMLGRAMRRSKEKRAKWRAEAIAEREKGLRGEPYDREIAARDIVVGPGVGEPGEPTYTRLGSGEKPGPGAVPIRQQAGKPRVSRAPEGISKAQPRRKARDYNDPEGWDDTNREWTASGGRVLRKSDFIDPETGEQIRIMRRRAPSARRGALKESLKRLDTNYNEKNNRWALLAGIK